MRKQYEPEGLNLKVILYLVGCVEAAPSSPLMLFRNLSALRVLFGHQISRPGLIGQQVQLLDSFIQRGLRRKRDIARGRRVLLLAGGTGRLNPAVLLVCVLPRLRRLFTGTQGNPALQPAALLWTRFWSHRLLCVLRVMLGVVLLLLLLLGV